MYQVVYSNTLFTTIPKTGRRYSTSVRLISRETLLTRKEKYYLTINGDDPSLSSHNTNGEIVFYEKESAFKRIFPIWARSRLTTGGRYEQIKQIDHTWDGTMGKNPVIDYIMNCRHLFIYQTHVAYFDGFSYELELAGWSGGGPTRYRQDRRDHNLELFFRSVLPSFNPSLSYRVRMSNEKLWIYLLDVENNKPILWSYNQDVETLFLLFVYYL